MKYWMIVLALAASSCGNLEGRKTTYSGTRECVDDKCTSMFDVEVKKADRLMNQRQLVPNLRKCLGLSAGQLHDDTKAAYMTSVPSLSKDGDMKELSSAMVMAVTKVASELCMDLIRAERNTSNRNYFMGYTLSGTGDSAQSFDATATLRKFGTACWGREVTTSERQFLTQKITVDFGKTTEGALLLCTTILSSAETIRY